MLLQSSELPNHQPHQGKKPDGASRTVPRKVGRPRSCVEGSSTEVIPAGDGPVRGTTATMKDASSIIAADLSTSERVLLFCLASGTEWAEAGVTGATVTAMVVRGLVDRDAAARLVLTPDGRAVLDALLGE
jgi:hypothetical protein